MDYWSSDKAKRYFVNKPANALMIEWLQKNELLPLSRGIDIGCGYGRNTRYLQQYAYHWTAFDPCEDALIHMKDTIDDKVRLLQSSVQACPLANEQFDLCVVDGVMHQVLDDKAYENAIQYLHKITSPSGHVFISTFTINELGKDLKKLDGNIFQTPTGTSMRLMEKEQIVRMFEEFFILLERQDEVFSLDVGVRSNISLLLVPREGGAE